MLELILRSQSEVEHVVFCINAGAGGNTDERASLLREHGVEVHETTVRSTVAGRSSEWTTVVPRILAAERRIGNRIDRLGFDAVVVHHQRYTQAPLLLRTVSTPSAYFVNEPRRQSFEYDLRPRSGASGPLRAVSGPVIRGVDSAVRRLDIAATRSATNLMCNSEHVREYVWRAYGRDATVVPLGVDLERFSPDSATPRRAEVLAVAAIERPKGLDLAVDALALIPKDRRPPLRIVHSRSDATYAMELQQRARQQNVRLVLEHRIGDEALVERYRSAVVCLLTARLEPLGLTALEAGACGTPVVAVREGGYRETVQHGITGRLTDRNPASVSEAIDGVLLRTESFDPRVIRSTVEQCRPWSRAVEAYVETVARTAAR